MSTESKDELKQNNESIPSPVLVEKYRIPKDGKINDDSEAITTYNFIGNQYYAPASKEYFYNLNPATNKPISRIPRSNMWDINYAVSVAKKAFKPWSRLPYDKRSEYLKKLSTLIKQRLIEFATLESRDNGKPLSLAKMIDIPRAVKNFEFFASQIQHDYTATHQMHNALNYSHRSALGVCGLITPWNLPLYLLTWKIAPAIACGNTVVCKPSELTPMTAYLLTDCIIESGIPPGVINIIQGYGKECGEPLCIHNDVTAISFTGGTLTGKRISAVAAPLFKKLSLELGGKNATIIFDDVDDFEGTVTGAVRAAFANQGQICLCGSRIFIHESLYDKFLKEFVAKTKSMFSDKIGDPLTCGYGSLVSLQHRGKIEKYVNIAKKEGGNIILGGARPIFKNDNNKYLNNGAFYLPTIISDLSPYKSKCATEEIFGPVCTVHKFKTELEVLDMVNSTTQYGLAGSVWTKDLIKAHRVAQEIETGMIWVNCWLYRDLRVPFGGVKSSGVGRDGGMHSMDFWTETKNICVKIPQLPLNQ
eukprot:523861_1